jgi:CheY-like chemotaxis protein
MSLQPRSEPFRVFIVDDSPAIVEGLGVLLAQTPEGDILYVGGHTQNSPDLPQRVRDAQANVVLLDLNLRDGTHLKAAKRHSETSGFAVYRALQQSSGPPLKIIGYSMWSDYRGEAQQYGFHGFVSKAASVAEIRQAIRGDISTDPFHLGRITGLELFVAHREFVLHGVRSTGPIGLEPSPFALLYYLTLERQQNAQDWALREGGKRIGQGDPQYHMTALAVWKNVNKACGGMLQGDQGEYLPAAKIAPWATKINAAVRSWHDQSRTISLIQVPRPEQACYTLAPSITSEGIRIHLQAQGESTA